MKLNKHQYIYLVAFFCFFALLGCKSKEKTVERTKQSDTLITKSLDYVSQPIQTTITIDEICDTLGTLRNFRQIETSGSNKAKVYTKDNTLNIDLLTGLSRFKTDTIYKTEFKDVYRDREIIRYKTPFWMWITIIGLSLTVILLVYILFKPRLF